MKSGKLFFLFALCALALVGCDREPSRGVVNLKNDYHKSIDVTVLCYSDDRGRFVEIDKYTIYPDSETNYKYPIGDYIIKGERDNSSNVFDIYYRSFTFTLTEKGIHLNFD